MGDRFNMEIWVGGDANGKEKELFDFLEENDLARHDDEDLGISPHLHFYCHDVPGDHLEDLKTKLRAMNLPYEHHIEAKWEYDGNLYYWHPGMESEDMVLATQMADPVVTIDQLEWELTNYPAMTLQEVIAKHKPPYLPGLLCGDITCLYDDEQDEEPPASAKTFTVIGYYDDTLQRYCGTFHGATWVDAVQACISSVGTASTLMIVDVFEGELKPLTEAQSVEPAVDFPMPEQELEQP